MVRAPPPRKMSFEPEIEEVERLLSALVAIPSVNPCGHPPDGEVTGEGRVAEFVSQWLEERGLEVELDEVLPGRPNVVARVGEGKRTILFETHLDTVPPEGEADFRPRREGEFLLGRGACDAKGALCAMMLALEALAREGVEGRAILAAVVDEEHTYLGVRKLLEGGLHADAAVVGEPTGLRVVVGHKGAIRFKVRTKGRAAHSSEPERGENAIEKMVSFLSRFSPLLREAASRHVHPRLGPATVNVGVIRGGTRANVVPAECEIEADRRVVPPETLEGAWEEVEEVARRASEEAKVEAELLPPHLLDPWLLTDESEEIVRASLRALEEAGVEPHLAYLPYSTDASKLSQAGIPSVVLGPGEVKYAHSANERIELGEVRRGAKTYFLLAKIFLGGGKG